GSLDAVIEHRREIGQTYDLAADFEGAIARIDGRIAEAQAELSDAAYRLSHKRHEVAERIEEMIREELTDLGMPHSQFVVEFALEPDEAGWIAFPNGPRTERLRSFPTGPDVVEFYVTTNVGEEPRPLAKVASG